MPRVYKRALGSRSYRNFTEEALEEALLSVAENRLSLRKAAKQFNIPYGTLNNKFNGKHIRIPGRAPVFSEGEEIAIINGLIKCSEWGFPLNIQEVQSFTKMHLELQGRDEPRFKDNVPGEDWVRSLLKRHKNSVGQRLASNLKKAKAEVSRASLTEYFNNMEETLEGVPPSNIFNYDESNMADDPQKKRGIYRRGVKYPTKVCNHTKSATSIMMCGSASGVLLPPYIIYKSEGIYDTWKEGGPKGKPCCSEPCCSRGTRYSRTKHGWMDSNTFDDWFQTLFLPHAKRLDGKVILLGDNLSSHFNENVLNLCEANNIAFVCLPPNTTHLCQPLDVAFFRPLKMAWRSELLAWKEKHAKVGAIPKHIFPSLIKVAMEKMDSVPPREPGGVASGISRNLISGFKATGIVPFNPMKVLEKLPEEIDAVDVEARVNDSLLAFLQSQRLGNQTQQRAPRKKKIQVAPGKSVTAGGMSSEDEEDSVDDLVGLSASDESAQEEASGNESEGSDECLEQGSLCDITPGRYALVKFLGGTRKKSSFRYVCIVQEVSGKDIQVMGMKSVHGSRKVFRAVENDISIINEDDVIGLLANPSVESVGQRVIYRFNSSIDIKEG